MATEVKPGQRISRPDRKLMVDKVLSDYFTMTQESLNIASISSATSSIASYFLT